VKERDRVMQVKSGKKREREKEGERERVRKGDF